MLLADEDSGRGSEAVKKPMPASLPGLAPLSSVLMVNPSTPHEMSWVPKLLLLDTCGSAASVAVADGREIVGEWLLPGRSASEELIGVIDRALSERNWQLRELDALLVVQGPGSFTGIRVGLSAAKALAEVSERPLIAVSRLQVLAVKAAAPGIVMLDAGRGDVFWTQVRDTEIGEQGIAPRAWVVEHARTLGLRAWTESDGTQGAGPTGVQVVDALTAADALPLAMERLLSGSTDDPVLLDGLYLHKTEQEILDRQRSHRTARATGDVRA